MFCNVFIHGPCLHESPHVLAALVTTTITQSYKQCYVHDKFPQEEKSCISIHSTCAESGLTQFSDFWKSKDVIFTSIA